MALPTRRPLFSDDEDPVDEAFRQVDLAAGAQVCGQSFEHRAQRAVA